MLKLILPLPDSDNKRLIPSWSGRLVSSNQYRDNLNAIASIAKSQNKNKIKFILSPYNQALLQYHVYLKDWRRDASNVEKQLKDAITTSEIWNTDKYVCTHLQRPIQIDSDNPRVEVEIYDGHEYPTTS